MRKNVVIIGSGQLGSRHLQALAVVKQPLNISVIDKSAEALKTARSRFKQIDTNRIHTVKYSTSLPLFKHNIDIAIIATNSDVRANVTKNFVNHCNVKNIIFEKTLFPFIEEYREISGILDKNAIKAWVNCTRRYYPFYQKIKKKMNQENSGSIIVSGMNWGLGCNSIHFIDLASFLFDDNNFIFNTSFLSNNIITSKRKGFTEFTGTLISTSREKEIHLVLHSGIGNFAPINISITSENHKYFISEFNKTVTYSNRDNNWKEDKFNVDIPNQSALTNLYLEDIFKTGECNLTAFECSSNMHCSLIKSLKEHYGKELLIT